jgi:hypothetical protein
MSYYLYTGKAYYARTHIVVGWGEIFVSGCGIKWKRDSNPWKEMKREKLKLNHARRYWPELKDLGVTCVHCIERGYPPHRWPKRNQEDNGPSDVHRGKRGSLDVDLRE